MKLDRMMLIVLVVLGLLAVGCSKKAMENQSSLDENQSPQPEQQQEAAVQPELAQETEPSDSGQVEGDTSAAQNHFLNEYIYFDYDSAVLRTDAMEQLRAKAEWLENNTDVNLLVIQGHCDERGTNAYNMALGAKRADAVKQYLTDLGLSSHRFETQSFGEERPLDSGHTEEAWAKNRRAAFVINQ